jgi:hypothetical protein
VAAAAGGLAFIFLGVLLLILLADGFGRLRLFEREAAKAAGELRHIRDQEEKQEAPMDEFHRPPARTPDHPEERGVTHEYYCG